MSAPEDVVELPYVAWPQQWGLTSHSLAAALSAFRETVADSDPIVLAGYHNPDSDPAYILVLAGDFDLHRDLARDDGHLLTRLAG